VIHSNGTISFAANFQLLIGISYPMLHSAIARGADLCKQLVHSPFIFVMDEAQELFELKLERTQYPTFGMQLQL
jgi:hypothetical protein